MPSRGRIVAVEGPSGAGKSTLTRALARAPGWVRLPEAFDRLHPAPSLFFGTPAELLRIERALLREDRVRFREARRHRNQGRTVVADTGFWGPVTYTAGLVARGKAPPSVLRSLLFRGLADGRSALPDLIVYLEVPAPTRRARAVRDPRRHPAALVPRHESVGRIERGFYRGLARAGLRIRFVRADRSIRTVANEIRRLVEGLERSEPSTKSVSALLRTHLLRAARRRRPRKSRRASRHR